MNEKDLVIQRINATNLKQLVALIFHYHHFLQFAKTNIFLKTMSNTDTHGQNTFISILLL